VRRQQHAVISEERANAIRISLEPSLFVLAVDLLYLCHIFRGQAASGDPDPRKNGCPKVRITKGAIEILERIEFDTGKATLRPESDPLLAAIRRALAEHPEIRLVRLEGYTDSRGKPGVNLKLSQSRVETVLVWLVEHGIEPERLTAKGYGKANPIATNKTEDGRQANRRVQITILKQEE